MARLNDKFKAGIIGLGVGFHHLNFLNKYKNCINIKVFDSNKKNYKYIKKNFKKISFALNSDEILADKKIDLVIICSYDNFHANQIIKSLKNKKFIFCEKPICLTKQELKKIKKTQKKYNHFPISSNFILRNSPQFINLKKRLRNKEFGKVYHIHGEYNYGRLEKITKGWRSKIPFYSVVLGGAVHLIDLAIFLKDDLPTQVFATSNKIASIKTNYKYHDFVKAIFKYKDGCIFSVTANFGCVMPHHHQFNLYGTKKTFIQNTDNAKIFSSREKNKNSIILKKKYINNEKVYILSNYIDYLRKKTRRIITTKEIFNSMSLCFAIHESLKKKKLIKIIY